MRRVKNQKRTEGNQQKGSVPEISEVKSDWRGLFNSKKSFGKLQYFEPQIVGGVVEVCSLDEEIEEEISKWRSSLAGQFLDKSLPFYLVKKSVDFVAEVGES
jgi:hypothetical protein